MPYYLDACFNLAAKKNVRLHGFAVTDPQLLLRYPWHSVDSKTWKEMASYGFVLYPDGGKQQYVNVDPKANDPEAENPDLPWLARILEAEGFDLDTMRLPFSPDRGFERFINRAYWNMHFILNYAKWLEVEPWSPLEGFDIL